MTWLMSAAAGISRWSGTVAGWLLLPLILATAYEVFARYALGQPTLWAYELGYICSGSLALLGMAYTSQMGQHTRIDVAYARMSRRWKAAVDLLTYGGILLPFLLYLLPTLSQRAIDAWASMERTGQSAWNPVIWPVRAIFAIAFLLLLLQAIAQAVTAAGQLLAPTEVDGNPSTAGEPHLVRGD